PILGPVGEDHLTGGDRMHGDTLARPVPDLDVVVGADLVDVVDPVTVGDRQPGVLPGELRQQPQVRVDDRDQVGGRTGHSRQGNDLGADPVAAVFVRPFYCPDALQGPDQASDGTLGQVCPLGQLGDPEVAGHERLQETERSYYRLYVGHLPLSLRVQASGYCAESFRMAEQESALEERGDPSRDERPAAPRPRGAETGGATRRAVA